MKIKEKMERIWENRLKLALSLFGVKELEGERPFQPHSEEERKVIEFVKKQDPDVKIVEVPGLSALGIVGFYDARHHKVFIESELCGSARIGALLHELGHALDRDYFLTKAADYPVDVARQIGELRVIKKAFELAEEAGVKLTRPVAAVIITDPAYKLGVARYLLPIAIKEGLKTVWGLYKWFFNPSKD